jgi:hypothetical protein
MAGHSRSKNGVAALAYVPAIHVLPPQCCTTWIPGTGPGMTPSRWTMRAEIERLVEEIKQSVGLLRRHL